jgi:integrase/recombinase XerD
MKRNYYSIKPFWDKRAMDKQTKLSRIMLTLNLRGHQFRITLNLKSSKLDFEKAISSTARNLSDEAKSVRQGLNDYLSNAELILARLNNPTQETFTKLFKSKTDLFINSKTMIAPFFESKSHEFFKKNKFSTSRLYILSLSSLTKYSTSLGYHVGIAFENIDEKFLTGYVEWMIAKGNSIATAGIYLRNLRSIFNDVIKAGVIAESLYPFRNFRFSSHIKSKAVLYPQQLKQLLNYECNDERDKRAIAYFFFCYLCNGMNFQDAGHLQYKNIQGNILTFVRHKTKNTGKEIKVYMHDLTKQIIKKWGNKNTNPDDYIFGLIDDKKSAFEIQRKLNRHKLFTNKSLSRVGQELGFGVHLCLNLARHSFATKLKIDNISVAAISDAMGHSNTTVTEHYMKSLPSENLKIMSNSLLAF